MRKLRPVQTCLVINENEKEKHDYEVEKLSSTSCLSSATAANQNKNGQKLYSIYPSLLLTASLLATKRTWVIYATSLLMKFWLCSYTEKLYTSKSLSLSIFWLFESYYYLSWWYMWTYKNDYYAVLIIVVPTHKKRHKQV